MAKLDVVGNMGLGLLEGGGGDVHGQDAVAAGGQQAGEKADGAAGLEDRGVVLVGQGGHGHLTFAGLIPSGAEPPRVGVTPVEVVEVGLPEGHGPSSTS